MAHKIWKTPEGYVEKKFNWIYKLTLKQDPRYYYIGSHSSNVEPEQDRYSGSGRGLLKYRRLYGKDCFIREILSFWDTKEELLQEEARIVTLDLVKDPYCINRIVGGGTFNTAGTTHKTSLETRRKISEGQKGKKISQETKDKIKATRLAHGPYKRTEKQKHCMDRFKGVPRSPEVLEKRRRTLELHGPYRRSEEYKALNRQAHVGRVWVNNGEISRSVWPEESEQLLAEGWVKGRILNPVTRLWINKQGEVKFIDRTLLEQFKQDGWQEGRVKGTTTGRVWITSVEDKSKLVAPEKVEEYLERGWRLGVDSHRQEVFNRKGKFKIKQNE